MFGVRWSVLRSGLIQAPSLSFATLFVVFLYADFVGAQAEFSIADAAEKQDWKLVSEKIEAGGDTLTAQADGMTALHWAAFSNKADIANSLIKADADVDAKTIYKVSPLSLACECGSVGVAKELLLHKPDLEAKRLGGETPLMLAARNGKADLVKMLVDAGAKVDATEVNKQTALMWASAAGNAEVVDVLIKAGADIEFKTGFGFSAFLFAAREGKTDCVLRLLEAGVNVNSVIKPQRSSGRNPRKSMSAVMFAIESGHFELALKLIEKGADPNDQRSGYAALHAITWVRKTKRGDDPSGDPAPRTTGSVNSLDFVRRLVKLGANVNLRLEKKNNAGKAKLNHQKATPFLLASSAADIPLMKLLVELGADPTLTNIDECTALMAAAGIGVVAVGEEPGTEEEVEEAIKMLVELGLDVNAVDKNGETAMHGAAYRSFPPTAKLLAKLGADPEIWNRENKHGWTPHLIATGKRPGSVKPSPAMTKALNAALK